MGKRHRWPNSESASLQSSRRVFDSWELVLLGPVHVKLSSGHCENHPPLQQPTPPPIPAEHVEVSSVLPARQKCTRKHHAHLQQRAPPPVLDQIGGRARPVFKGIDGGGKSPSDPALPAGFEPPCSGRAPSALPLGQRPPRYVWPLFRAATARRACTHEIIPAICASVSFSFFLLGPRSLTVTPAGLGHSSVHSRRHPDLAAFAFASRQRLPPAVRTRRL